MYSQFMKEKLNADDMKINQLKSLTKRGFYLKHCDMKKCDIIRVFRPAVNSSYLTLFFETPLPCLCY
jgi:hypothetical protein